MNTLIQYTLYSCSPFPVRSIWNLSHQSGLLTILYDNHFFKSLTTPPTLVHPLPSHHFSLLSLSLLSISLHDPHFTNLAQLNESPSQCLVCDFPIIPLCYNPFPTSPSWHVCCVLRPSTDFTPPIWPLPPYVARAERLLGERAISQRRCCQLTLLSLFMA